MSEFSRIKRGFTRASDGEREKKKTLSPPSLPFVVVIFSLSLSLSTHLKKNYSNRVTTSSDLMIDARRDLDAIGALGVKASR